MTREIKNMDDFNKSVEDRFYLGMLIFTFSVLFLSFIWLTCACLGFNPFYEIFKYLIK